MAEGEAEVPAETGGGGGEPPTRTLEPGVAPIKAQYLTTKEQFHEFLEAPAGQVKADGETESGGATGNGVAEPEAKRARLEDGQSGGGQTEDRKEVEEEEGAAGEPREHKKAQKRARGQHKNRPHLKPADHDSNRLCPSLVQGLSAMCLFGDRCRYLHDVAAYLEQKPPDLGSRCPVIETLGRCPYGITCRFAGAHLAGGASPWGPLPPPVRNGLDKALQRQLRKHQVRFQRSEEALRRLSQSPLSGVLPEPFDGDTVGPDAGVAPGSPLQTCGPLTDEDVVKLRACEKKRLDFHGKLYLAPLTTCGNLPFRRICKRFGADVTCGEMAVCTNLLQGQTSEWALLKRHPCEDIFGVQLEGAFPDTMTKCAELLNRTIDVDFVDINVGCPIDLVYKKGGGCALMNRTAKFQQIVRGMNEVLDVPLTVKIRTGVQERVNLAHRLLPELRDWGAAMVTVHGRSREQRYTKCADWEYIRECVQAASPMPLFGNGDILSYEDAERAMQTGVAGFMVGRGALLKPWLFTELRERRHWDISSSERLDMLRDFTRFGLEHWGSDTRGVEVTRRFLLEWLSFLCRYIPVGLLDRLPQKINERPPYYLGRDHLETLMASPRADDWVRISEMLLGPVPPNFVFLPKHKANAYK
ncbi:tRNA-dihydrouridine(47) synthase [NAD(P)(+)]-like [Erinaceus europaeus]|uniref:tRNA-dihydrouridine(47) synthase [NAD(P)(+)] n=1 Tax=Erinaceus europaeus TaxID=9365 RepID=A0A1S2ZUV7_ERIEU|nr:tRNA-dihydrouridine(47) synthase [NAD(P)(+)]-like [Erinaceus europaeus]